MDIRELEKQIRMQENRGVDREYEVSLAMPKLMRKVYVWMALALAITGVTAFGMSTNFTFLNFIAENSWAFWAILIAELGLVWGISGAINRISLTVATLLFILYSIINGLFLSFVFLVYTQESIAQVFFITSGTFAAMAVFGYLTKKDLSGFGRILIMGLIGLVIATIVNMFLKSSGFSLILSYVGVLIFVGLTAYDTQKIKRMLSECYEPNEEAHKIALLGSLTLYLDFINLFLYLLRIFGDRK